MASTAENLLTDPQVKGIFVNFPRRLSALASDVVGNQQGRFLRGMPAGGTLGSGSAALPCNCCNNPEESSSSNDPCSFESSKEDTSRQTLPMEDSKDESSHTNESLDEIMTECSSAAQEIKNTINEVLKGRETQPQEALFPDNLYAKLEEGMKEMIADLDHVGVPDRSCVGTSAGPAETSTNVGALTLPCKMASCGATEATEQESQSSCHATDPLVTEAEEASHCDMPPCSSQNDVQESDTIMVPAQDHPEDKSSNQEGSSRECSPSRTDPLDNTQIQTLCTEDVSQIKKKSPKKCPKGPIANKKRGEKTLDQILKSLAAFPSPEEKLLSLCRKHSDLLDSHRLFETRVKNSERQVAQLTREKEQLQADHNRTVLAKCQLESLCRELQRQNKAVKEESLLRIREEEEKRKEVASKFQGTLNDITTLMTENQQRNSKLKEENSELANKLKALVDHYEKWEKHMQNVVRQKELEAQLAKAKLAKGTLQFRQEKDDLLKEKHQLLESIGQLQKRGIELASNEHQLRTELGLYTTKYEEFQSVLNKSNEVFASFKVDMEKMSKKIKKLEKETCQWRSRWENSNRALLEMAADKQKRDHELLNYQQRVLTLEKLCRALQAERVELQNQLKGHLVPCSGDAVESNKCTSEGSCVVKQKDNAELHGIEFLSQTQT